MDNKSNYPGYQMRTVKISDKRTKIVISVYDIIWFFVLIWYFESPYLARFEIINLLYIGMKLLSVAYILCHFRKFEIHSMVIIVILSELALWYSTYRMGASVISVTTQAVSIVVFIITMDIMLKENAHRCIRVLYVIMELLIYMNVVTALVFPNGLYNPLIVEGTKKYYFLGQQNAMGIYSVIGIALGEIRLQIYHDRTFKRIRLLILELISLFYIFKVWSAISMIGVMGMIAMNLYNKMSKKGWRFPFAWSIAVNVVIFIMFVVLQNIQMFALLFQKVLKRGMTLSGRTIIWLKALGAFLQEPFWGMGYGQGTGVFGFATAHNRYMNILFTSGLVGMVLFIIILFLIWRKLKDTSKNITRLLVIYFTILLLIMQGETLDGIPFYIMFMVCCKVQYLGVEYQVKKQAVHVKCHVKLLLHRKGKMG